MNKNSSSNLLLWFFENTENISRPILLLTSFFDDRSTFRIIKTNKLVNQNSHLLSICKEVDVSCLVIPQIDRTISIRNTKLKIKHLAISNSGSLYSLTTYFDAFINIHDSIEGIKVSMSMEIEDIQCLLNILSKFKSLNKLDLQSCKLTNTQIIFLSKFIETNTIIGKLDLSKNLIQEDEIIVLCNALMTNTSLTDLNLEQNQIKNKGAFALAVLLQTNTALSHLNLQHNEITETGILALYETLKLNNATLVDLDLRWNLFGEVSLILFVFYLKELPDYNILRNRIKL